MPTFLLIDDSDQLVTLFSGVAAPETAMGIPTLGGVIQQWCVCEEREGGRG